MKLNENLLTFEQRQQRYIDYVKSIDTKRFTTGIPLVDKAIRGVAPGEVLTIIAYSGTGKSFYLQNLLASFAMRTKMFQLFFSLEMPTEKVYERELQIAYGTSGYQVELAHKIEKADFMIEAAKKNGSEHVLVCEKNRLTINDMVRFLHMAEAKHGPVGAVGIDYLGLMRGEGKTIFERMAELSFGLKDMAKEQAVPIILLGQVNRQYAASKGVEIEMDAAKGGGDIEAGCDYMFGLMNHEEDIILKVLKNRNGPKGQYFRLEIDKGSFQIFGAEEWTPPNKGKKDDDCPF